MLHHVVNEQPYLASAARTTSGQSNGHRVDGFIEGFFTINISASSGTGRKLTIRPQVSFDDSTYFDMDVSAMELTANGQYLLPVTNFGRYLRFKYEIAGTSASFTFAVTLIGKT